MKKTDKMYLKSVWIVAVLIFTISFVEAQTVLYSENFGTPSSTTLVQNYSGWQSNVVLYTSDGTCDVRSSYASTDYARASGGGNVMLNDTVKWFQISNLNTQGQEDALLYCGIRKSTAVNGTELLVEASSDSLSWYRLALLDSLPTGAGTSGWYWVHFGGVPLCEHLHIRFSNTGTTDFRIDDLFLVANGELADPEEPDEPDVPTDTTAVLSYSQVPFCLYPNPTKDWLNIHYGGMSVLSMQLFDIYGHEVARWDGELPEKIGCSSFPYGVYILKVHAQEGDFQLKVVRY
ncbi:MAG: T9SS type A sorting domain-containing protein [Bacteroidales bacterium]|nr:T9SS type A sorting domain-containing protein [Bacteroidales bacterium]